MRHSIRRTGLAFSGVLLALMGSSLLSAQVPGSEYCRDPIRSTDAFTAQVSAEINSEGDLLVLLDTDEDGIPERAFHGAPQQPEKLADVVERIQAFSGQAKVSVMFRTSVAASAFEIGDGQSDGESIRVMAGSIECFPDETATDLWLVGLAHYTLSNFEPLARSRVEGLRQASLLRKTSGGK